MMLRYFILLLVTTAFFSCSNNKTGDKTKDQPAAAADTTAAGAKKELMPALHTCDSAVVMYYHTPGDPRFFNMTKVHRMDSLAVIVKEVNATTIAAKDSCTTEGKIYFYQKEAVYPVYFNRNDTCLTLSFIITGEKYMVSMSKEAAAVLNDMEKRVKVLSGRKED